jgi:hypothetical protein
MPDSPVVDGCRNGEKAGCQEVKGQPGPEQAKDQLKGRQEFFNPGLLLLLLLIGQGLKAVKAEQTTVMITDTFPAKIAVALRATSHRFSASVMKTVSFKHLAFLRL